MNQLAADVSDFLWPPLYVQELAEDVERKSSRIATESYQLLWAQIKASHGWYRDQTHRNWVKTCGA